MKIIYIYRIGSNIQMIIEFKVILSDYALLKSIFILMARYSYQIKNNLETKK